MDGKVKRNFIKPLIYANAFVVGIVLMGFEMLGSRYLNPYFGSGIGAWASLISVVLCALAIGYFVGGNIVDKNPSPYNIPIAVTVAAAYLACVPATADGVMRWILQNIGDGPSAILLAASVLLLVPLTFLGTLSPMAVRLLLNRTEQTGRVSGLVYAVSTFGNVFGTLYTTFGLIPNYGSREVTYIFAVTLAICALSLFIAARKAH